MAKITDPFSEEEEPFDLQKLSSDIFDQYIPCTATEAKEIISHTDLAETLRITTGDYTLNEFYQAMIGAGFTPLTVEGSIYWPLSPR